MIVHQVGVKFQRFSRFSTPSVTHAHIRSYQEADENAVVALWSVCGLIVPQNDPRKDIARKVADSPELFLIAESGGRLIGSCMAGYEGHRGWINYLAVHPDFQRQGLATRLMSEAQQILIGLGCPKINLQIRRTNPTVRAFYESLGFTEDEVISMGIRLINDSLP